MKRVNLIPLWKALADSKRRRIIQLLRKNTHTTSEISAHFDVSRFAIMQHLRVLEQAGLIQSKREGRHRWYFLNEELFHNIGQTFLETDETRDYQLEDIFSFLARQEWVREEESAISDHLHHFELVVSIKATSERIFQALTDEIDAWWSYRTITDSHMYLEAQVGGRFYESFNDGGGTLYATLTCFRPGKEIRLRGSLGLVDESVNSIVILFLQPQLPDTTTLKLTHRFLGEVKEITVDTFKSSWTELLTQHLKKYIEQGNLYQALP